MLIFLSLFCIIWLGHGDAAMRDVKNINPTLDLVLNLLHSQFNYLPIPDFSANFTGFSSLGSISLTELKFGRLSTMSRDGDAELIHAGNNLYSLDARFRQGEVLISFRLNVHFNEIQESAKITFACKDISSMFTFTISNEGKTCTVSVDKASFDGHLGDCKVVVKGLRQVDEIINAHAQNLLRQFETVIKHYGNMILLMAMRTVGLQPSSMLCKLVKN